MAWFKRSLLLLCLAGVPAMPAAAVSFSGSSSAADAVIHFQPEQLIKFSKKVEKAMAAKGARVAILARMGRPPSELPEGMHFTHVAFAVYSQITTRDGRQLPGYAIYNLYQSDGRPDVSSLVTDFPLDFFAGVSVLEAGVVVPSPALQQRLLEVIAGKTYGALHDSRYSVIANPYNAGRQNCTEFVLDVVNSALHQTDDYARLKDIAQSGFKAQKVNVNPLKLMFGSMLSKEVSLTDHDGDPVTATFETISEYLARVDAGSQAFTVQPD